MIKAIQRQTHEIDAAGLAAGRVATEAARLLGGKNKPDFARHLDRGDAVTVRNAAQVKFTGRKLEQKDFYHHTMYRGGLTRTPLKHVFTKDPAEVLRRAIYGMLPKNSFRDEMMKRLTIVD